MFPFTRVPFWVPIFDPYPCVTFREVFSFVGAVRTVPQLVGAGGGGGRGSRTLTGESVSWPPSLFASQCEF